MGIAYSSKCLDYTIYGKSEQITSTGEKNKFNQSLLAQGTKNGVNCTYNESDDTLVFNGTCTGGNAIFRTSNANIEYTRGTTRLIIYYVSGDIVFADGASINVQQADSSWSVGKYVNLTTAPTDKIWLNSLYDSASARISIIGFEIKPGTTFKNLVLRFMVTNDANTTYESYDIRPTPEHPSKIKCVDGVRNLFDKDNVKKLNAWFNAGTPNLTSDANNRTLYIPCKANTTYTVYKIRSAVYAFGYTKELPATGVEVFNVAAEAQYIGDVGYKTIKTGDDAEYLVLRYLQATQDTIPEQQVLDSIMIEEGYTLHKYVPYGSWLRVDDVGISLLDFSSTPKSKSSSLDYTFSNNIIDVKMNTSGTYSYIQWDVFDILKNNKGKTLAFGYKSVEYTDRSGVIAQLIIDKSGTKTYPILIDGNGAKKTYEIPNNIDENTSVVLGIYANNTGTARQSTLKLVEPILYIVEDNPEGIYSPYFALKTYFLPLDKDTTFQESFELGSVSTTNGQDEAKTNRVRTGKIRVLPNFTYTLNAEGVQQVYMFYYNQNGFVTSKGWSNLPYTFENKEYTHIRCAYRKSNDATIDLSTISNLIFREEGTFELCSIGDVRDEYVVENGYADIGKKIKKIVFNGSENWRAISNAGSDKRFAVSLSDATNLGTNKVMCSHFISEYTTAKTDVCFLSANAELDIIDLDFKRFGNLDTFKNWLKEQYDNGTPVTIYYELTNSYTADMGQVDFPIVNGEIKGIAYNGKEVKEIAYNGEVIYKSKN